MTYLFTGHVRGDFKIPKLKLITFCRKYQMLGKFCRSVTILPHIDVNGHLCYDSKCVLYPVMPFFGKV